MSPFCSLAEAAAEQCCPRLRPGTAMARSGHWSSDRACLHPSTGCSFLEVTLDHTEALTRCGRLGEARDRLVVAANRGTARGSARFLACCARSAPARDRHGDPERRARCAPRSRRSTNNHWATPSLSPSSSLHSRSPTCITAASAESTRRPPTTHGLRAVTVARAIGDAPTLLRALLDIPPHDLGARLHS